MRLLSFLLLSTLLSLSLVAQDKSQDKFSLNDTLKYDSKLVKGKLANGFTYYILPNSYPRKKLEFRLLVKAGSLNETENQRGLAHFMEHMNFNGSRTFQKNDFNHFFQSIGVRFGADINAFTYFDRTVYMLPVPTKKFENVEKAFRVMADWAHYATLKGEDIDNERGVVLNESLLNKGVGKRIQDSLTQYLHPEYNKRMPIGLDTIIKTFAHDTLRAFYRDWYRPDLMALVVVGDIDSELAKKQIKANFSNWQMPANPRPVPAQVAPPQLSKNQGFIVVDKEVPQYSLSLFFNPLPRKSLRSLADLKEDLTLQLLNILAFRRVQDALQDASTPFVSAGFNWIPNGFLNGYSLFNMVVIPSALGLEKAVQGAVQELRKMWLGFTQRELDDARELVLSELENQYREKDRTASANLAEDLAEDFYNGDIAFGLENNYHYSKYVLPQITLQDLKKTFSKFIANPHFIAALTLPSSQKSKAPQNKDELIAIVAKAFGNENKVEAKQEKVLDRKLLDETPLPGAIRSIKENTAFASTTFELSNGIQVMLKPTDFKNDEILIQFVASGGNFNFASSDLYNLYMLPKTMSSMGYGKFTGAELSKVLSGKNLAMKTYIDNTSHGFVGQSSVADLETFFQLLYLKINHPRFDSALFNAIKGRYIAATASLGANPNNAFFDTANKVVHNHNPYSGIVYPKQEGLEKTDINRVIALYKELFQRPADFKLYIVGNTSVEVLRPLLEKYIASLDVKGGTHIPFKDVGLRYKKGDTRFDFYKGTENKALLLMNFAQEQPYLASQEVPVEMLESILNMRMIDEIREKHSWVYTSEVNSEYKRIPYSNLRFLLVFPCGSEHIDSITTAVLQELSELSNEKYKKKFEPYLQRAKAQALEQTRLDEKENSYWLNALSEYGIYDRSPILVLNRSELINKVTLKEVQDIAKNIFKRKNLFRAILYPEKMQKTSQ